jgi:hypothetical protein
VTEQLNLEDVPKPKRRKRVVPPPARKLVQRTPKAPEPPVEPAGPVRLVLSIKHQINGTAYGPGVVEVPADLAPILRENEGRNIAEERGLTAPMRAALMLPGGRVAQVPAETFQDPESYNTLPVSLAQGG